LGQSFLHGYWLELAVLPPSTDAQRIVGCGPVARPYVVGTAPGAAGAPWIDCPTQSYGAEAAENNATSQTPLPTILSMTLAAR
jgi:hypothetical protein